MNKVAWSSRTTQQMGMDEAPIVENKSLRAIFELMSLCRAIQQPVDSLTYCLDVDDLS